jgi:hypothetical protein
MITGPGAYETTTEEAEEGRGRGGSQVEDIG